MLPYLIDTHTHFDVPEYESQREEYVRRSSMAGVCHLVMIGYQAMYFERMVHAAKAVNAMCFDAKGQSIGVQAHLAMGLHPLYIQAHHEQDLVYLESMLAKHSNVALAEIGLDTYLPALKEADIYAKQKRFFGEQLQLSKTYQLPIILHIRRAHADVLAILKAHKYHAHAQGGIAHSFSGGEQEALAFAKLGFKIGVTGQITNPNAKKLQRAIRAVVEKVGLSALVIETDCPDMMPVPCQALGSFNEPANLPYVLSALSELLAVDKLRLAEQLWQNSSEALAVDWRYPRVY